VNAKEPPRVAPFKSVHEGEAAAPNLVLDAARELLGRGCQPLALHPRSKLPLADRWNKRRLAPADLPQEFRDLQSNIGILLGKASGGLVDIDLDCDIGRELAGKFLPKTGIVFGRPGARGAHWLYLCEPNRQDEEIY
jgi:hypothetical protein